MKTWLFTIILFIITGISLSFVVNGCANSDAQVILDNSIRETYISSLVYDAETRKFFKDKESNEYYTGTAIERNDKGELVREYGYEDGVMVKAKIWTDFGGVLKQTIDMEYKDHRAYNGWYNILIVLPENGKMTNIYSEFKNGQKIAGWNLFPNKLQMLYAPFDEEKEVLFEATNKDEFYTQLRSELNEIKPKHFNMLADGNLISSEY